MRIARLENQVTDVLILDLRIESESEVQARAILLDDDPARKLAVQLGLPVIGTAGVLVLAKERQLIPAVRPCLDALIDS